MKQFLCVFLLALTFTAAKAQSKTAYIDLGRVVYAMPEYQKAMDQYKIYLKQFFARHDDITNEYKVKKAKFQRDSATWTSSIRQIHEAELAQLEARVESFELNALDGLQGYYDNLFNPIQQKAIDAVNEVGKENGFENIVTIDKLKENPGATDIMALVKKKLGIK